MTTTIALPRHSVVLILGRRKDDGAMARLADRVPAVASPWNVMKPDASLELLHETLKGDQAVRVVMVNSNGKARRRVASAAKKRGCVPIAIRLPGAEEMENDEGYARVIDLATEADVDFQIVGMPSDMGHHEGPFDFIGDIHGCFVEFMRLLVMLGYVDDLTGLPQRHPQRRTLVLLGDLTDRGPGSLPVLYMVRALETYGALRVLGNHDDKLAKWLMGREVLIRAGIETSIAEMEHLSTDERMELGAWLFEAEPHLILDGGRVVAAHAGISRELQGRHTSGARSFALYGKTTGRVDEDGRPEVVDWTDDYDGDAVVVHGHVVHPRPRIVGNVVAIDTGCVFGGSLTAYRWPERHFVEVKAVATHWVDDGRETA